MRKVGIISIACGSMAPGQACESSNLRDEMAVKLALNLFHEGYEPTVIVTGNVPRHPGGDTLADLKLRFVRRLLTVSELEGSVSAIKAEGGYDSFSEARFVTGTLAKLHKFNWLYLVSSAWYMPYGGKIWRRRAHENNQQLDLYPIDTPAGEKTRKIYRRNAQLLDLAIATGTERVLEYLVSLNTRTRATDGFTWSGCD